MDMGWADMDEEYKDMVMAELQKDEDFGTLFAKWPSDHQIKITQD